MNKKSTFRSVANNYLTHLEKNRGITLIALVVTIIVLLILAGISIIMLTGDNGVVTNASKSAVTNAYYGAEEQVTLAYSAIMTQIMSETVKNGTYDATTAKNTKILAQIVEKDLNDKNKWIVDGTEAGVIKIRYIDTRIDQGAIDSTSNPQVPRQEGQVDYVIQLQSQNSNLSTDVSKLEIKGPINWEKAKANAVKHPDQSSTNGDIGIGTDGESVNMDLWTYSVINENEIGLYRSETTECGIRKSAAYSNSNIVNGKIIGKVPQWIKIDGQDEFYEVTSMESTFSYCSNLQTMPEIPSAVSTLSYTFENSGLTSVVIPENITRLEWGSFSHCSMLSNVELSENLILVGGFGFCSNLTNIVIPEGPTEISSGAFQNCTSLTNVTIPKSVTKIGSGAFYYLPALINITYNGTKEEWGNVQKNDSFIMCPVICTDGVYGE